MEVLNLEPGIHQLPPITVPTRIVSTERWRAILEAPDNSGYAVEVKAPRCQIIGCQIRFASGDKGDQRRQNGYGVIAGEECKHLYLEDDWFHHNTSQGVYTHPNVALRMHRCLVERCGTHSQLDHGGYLKGFVFISNSLFLHNSGWQLAIGSGQSAGVVYRTVCYGSPRDKTIVHSGGPGRLAVIRCTLFGDAPTYADGTEIDVDSSTLLYPNSSDHQGYPDLIDSRRHLFFPTGHPEVKSGAYDYEPTLHTLEQATELWRDGWMDGWGEYAYVKSEMGHKWPFPLFPGDAVPSLAE